MTTASTYGVAGLSCGREGVVGAEVSLAPAALASHIGAVTGRLTTVTVGDQMTTSRPSSLSAGACHDATRI